MLTGAVALSWKAPMADRAAASEEITAAPAAARTWPASVRTRLRPSLRVSGTSMLRCSSASCCETAEGVT